MAVVCPACGKESRDLEFCDHCNADLRAAKEGQPPEVCHLPGGEVTLTAAQRRALGRVEDAVTLEAASGRWRVHWSPRAELPEWRPLLDDRLSLDLEVLPPTHTVETDSGLWVASQAATGGHPWHASASADPMARARNLVADVGSLAHTLGQLHRQGRIWLTFDPAALEDLGPLPSRADAEAETLGLRLWRITNLDLRLFRAGECPASLGFHAKFAAPEVCAFRAAEIRSEERRVGKECRSRWSPYH